MSGWRGRGHWGTKKQERCTVSGPPRATFLPLAPPWWASAISLPMERGQVSSLLAAALVQWCRHRNAAWVPTASVERPDLRVRNLFQVALCCKLGIFIILWFAFFPQSVVLKTNDLWSNFKLSCPSILCSAPATFLCLLSLYTLWYIVNTSAHLPH